MNNRTSQRKINFTKIATEQRLLESISTPGGFIADPLMIGVYSATLDEEEIEFDDAKDETDVSEVEGDAAKVGGRSRKETFLKSLEEKVDPTEHKERFKIIKNHIIEKVKATQYSRSRSRSCSAASRSDSKKRELSLESKSKEPGKSPVRPRTSGIPLPN